VIALMFKRCAVFVLVLLPLAASAQSQVPVPRAGPGASAPQGIAVQGRGVVRYPVKTVTFIAQTRGNADEAAVLAVMRAAGVDDPVIGPAGSQINNGPQTMLRGTIRDVSRAKLDRIAHAGMAYALAHPGTAIDSVNFFAAADECAQHEQMARAAAIADARRKAQALAALTDVALDGIVAVGESGGCPAAGEAPSQPFGGGNIPFDLGTLTATISINESVTFATVPAATPARRRTL
jgi:hypothetical protein